MQDDNTPQPPYFPKPPQPPTYTQHTSYRGPEGYLSGQPPKPKSFFGSPGCFLLFGGLLAFVALCGVGGILSLVWLGGNLDIPDQDPELNPKNFTPVAIPNATSSPSSFGLDNLSEAPQVGSLAPDFELVNVYTGEVVKLSDLRGKPVWINFWATWCPPCKQEMPEMQTLYEKHAAQGLEIVGVDVQESAADVEKFTTEGGFKWTFVLDEEGAVTDRYLVSGLPSHFFVDRDGVIQAIHVGGLENMMGRKAPVEEYLEKIIK